ncbi:spermidine/putrescine transport system permease protein [Sporobacter termitidis DSM 10068]|uniref:Spermidine/putrescine transport system permease protein n=1 Tax=Sporobacter termitidis DSM 10068 TaxID=1123282 RepID=A0A1M5XE65_9FIRM|nr:ABC transporter permease [Sporobacter termitidis]SHH98076.1 spermidine/putrescine transport system permease protein [Sporobacter termitidis DSM 10068]
MKTRLKIKSIVPRLTMTGPVAGWMILFVVIPFTYIFVISFMNRGTYGGVELGFTLQNYANIFDAKYLMIFLNSILLAAVTTALCILIAYPFTYFIAQKTAVTKTVFVSMVMIPFTVSSLVRIYSWINLLRKDGIINNLLMSLRVIDEPLQMIYNNFGVIVGMVYTLIPFMILPLYSSIEKLDKSMLEAGNDLGAKPARAFATITLPLTAPGIFAGAIMVFIPTLGYFFITDMLGGSKIMMIGNLIRNQFVTAKNWPFGAALSIFLIVLTLAALWVYERIGGDLEDLGGMR